ncbi:TRAP transporter small permease [Salicibibacter kimchii]|uniref:TRAP transporter small permease n=1 Tax=Salicibibacter kimchii TaxID=2099786 RepID=A0A345BW73_9BACI|nr:TRAP transporter small permease [Salicibibacter kimchii]AXF55204.1 TRAP transporter small permease [Salicibibacter kimchii]
MKNFIIVFNNGWMKVTRALQFVSNLLLFGIMLLIPLDVIGRYFFNRPVTGALELTELATGTLVFLSLAITHYYNEHVSVDFIVDKMPKRARNVLLTIIEFVIFILLIVMMTQLFSNALQYIDRGTTSGDLSIPVYPFIMLAAISVLVFALVALGKSAKHLIKAVEKS